MRRGLLQCGCIRFLRSGSWAALAALLLLAWGCVAPAPENSGGELYHHNWWNYYVRASFFLRENRVDEAAADFERCLGLIPGAKFGFKQDMWRARTYGIHFLEGYFPNRELGICLYERRDYAQAIRYLETSLKQEPSGRAKHYLNLAREKQLAGRGAGAPRIRMDSDGAVAFTAERTLRVRGEAAGEGLIRQLTVGARSEFIELAAPSYPFDRRVALAEGSNTVEVTAVDLLGQRATGRVVRIADWQPPRLLVRRVTAQGGGWLVEGVCRDDYGLAEVAVAGTAVFRASESGRARAEVPVSVRISGEGAPLVARDLAGNRLECPLSAAALVQTAMQGEPERDARGLPAPRAWACAGRGDGAAATVVERMEAWALECRRDGARQGFRYAAQAAPAVFSDRLRPALSLRGCRPVTRVFVEDFFVDGSAADGGGLASVTVNGENLLSGPDVGAVRTYFSRRLPLDLGTNRFEIAATDRSGNRTSQELTVIRICPEYLDERYRLSVGVPPLTPADAGLLGVRAKRSMEAELTREPVRFRLLERSEGWDFVLREQGLSVSDLADPAAALRIGKMVPAEMLLMGRVFNEAKGITVYLKVVETGNGEVVFASDVYSADPDTTLDEAVGGLVLKVEQGFPLITGEVLRCEGARVTLSVGRAEGAAEKSSFLVVEKQREGDDEECQVCKQDGQLVKLQVERVQQNTSTARVIPKGAGAIVKEGCHVYTR